MNPIQLKILLVGAAITGGIGLLAVDGSRSATVYYQTIPEFRSGSQAPSRTVRLTGYVVEGSITQKPGEPLRFVMRDKEGRDTIAVSYGNVVPDTFKDGAEVVVEGRMGLDQSFQAGTLLAKCPSKYESGEEGGAAAPRSQS